MTSAVELALTSALEAEDDAASSVLKALTLLAAVGSSEEPLGVTALARETGLPKSTAFRLLGLLVKRGLVERRGSRYALGLQVFELGNRIAHCQPRSLRDIALPRLVELYASTKCTAHLAILDGLDVLYLEKIHGLDPVPSPSHVGGRVPAHCTALGKALLAFQPRTELAKFLSRRLRPLTGYTIVVPDLLATELEGVRTAGYAIDREESCIGLTCVSAPVLDSSRRAVAAISLSGRTTRLVPERLAPAIRRAAFDIARDVSRQP